MRVKAAVDRPPVRPEYAVPPSRRVCIDQCGARCCRTVTMKIGLRTLELRRLKDAAAEIGKKIRVLHAGRDGHGDLWMWDFTKQHEPDGACVFLDRDTNECRAYDARPDACRKFPHRPFRGCMIWPGSDQSPSVG